MKGRREEGKKGEELGRVEIAQRIGEKVPDHTAASVDIL